MVDAHNATRDRETMFSGAHRRNRLAWALICGGALAAGRPAGATEPAAPALTIEKPDQATLRGGDARRQLVVTGSDAAGQPRDVTRSVAFEVSPAGVVNVDATGLVTPLADGKAVVTAKTSEGVVGSVEVKVEHFADPAPISFPNQIVPIFTKHGCNSGGCHGKASGQNGFKLSLLGFYPEDDHEFLVKETRGRRISPAAPEQSLILLKATNAVPHGGGMRIEPGSYEYRILRRWMLQGMPYGGPNDPHVERLEVVPDARVMSQKADQQLAVFAHYSDGSVDDVTPMAQYEVNDREMAESTPGGLVRTLDLAGEVAVMIRYQGQVGVFRATVPLGVKAQSVPPAKGFIDELVFQKLALLGVPPSGLCDDSTFLRRVSIDIAGRAPTLEETKAFLADKDPAKRDRLVDRLLASPEYADYFANKWSAVLRNKKVNNNYARGAIAFHDWVRECIYQNKPYDQFVREIVAASGETGQNPPVVWYRSLKTTEQQAEDSAQLFLGLRIQCARCHHHPFERWSQNDYYGYSAFFAQVQRKAGLGGRADEQRILHGRGVATKSNPRTGQVMKPAGLGAPTLDIPADADPRLLLADWMADPKNPFFAKALVNRYWKHFFNRGIVEPEDDLRVTNPPTNPQLLDALAEDFVKNKFDLKKLIATICKSSVYQLDSMPNEHNAKDKQNYSRYYPKRLNAEVLYDAIGQVTGVASSFSGMPEGTRAVQLPDSSASNYFLTVFGKPQGDSACECERSGEASLAQSLYLLNSAEIQGKLSSGGGKAAKLAQDTARTDEEKIRELYLLAYSREPSAEDLQLALGHLKKLTEKQKAYEDVTWALLNTKEFLFNH